MRFSARARHATLSLFGWPIQWWLLGIGVVLVLRFPVNFALHPPFLMDFDLFRTIAQRLLHGDARQLYAAAGSAQSLFKYAPCWALYMIPFGVISGHLGSILWSTLTILWLLATCWAADRLCRLAGLIPPSYLSVVAIVLIVRPITAEFLVGQTNILWGFLVTAFLLCEAMDRRWLAAVSLALAISLKVPALLFVVYLALCQRWDLFGRTFASLVGLNGLAASFLLPSQPLALFAGWVHVLATSGPDRAFEIGNQSFLALMGRLLRPDGYGLNLFTLPDRAVFAIATLLELLLFVAIIPLRTHRSSTAKTLVFDGALLNILMILFSPTCWDTTYSALLFPTFLAATLAIVHPGKLFRSVLIGFTALGVITLSAMTSAKLWHQFGVFHFKGESYVYLVLMILPLFGLMLTGYLVQYRNAVTRTTSDSPAVAVAPDTLRS